MAKKPISVTYRYLNLAKQETGYFNVKPAHQRYRAVRQIWSATGDFARFIRSTEEEDLEALEKLEAETAELRRRHAELLNKYELTDEMAEYLKIKRVVEPPRGAEFMLRLFLNKENRDARLGDLDEEFRTVMVPKFG
ncbi:MAG: hypothetical protein AAF942_00700, partial [Pseudomonadota bacterium]